MSLSSNVIKDIAPYLDPHLLLFLLQKTTDAKQTGALQNQIKDKLLINQKDKAKTLEDAAKIEAAKLLDVLNKKDLQKLREEHRFTLENLKKEKDIDLKDCHKLQKYAKVLYEQGKYKDAEELLFRLKEILVNEQNNNSDLMLQVFWGLLACQILNGKGRDVVENTTLKKMKDLINQRYADEKITEFQFQQMNTWLVHWILVYSFTAKDMQNTSLFATVLQTQNFFNIILMKMNSLTKYMIASAIISKGQASSKYQLGKNFLSKQILPTAIDLLNQKSEDCAFSKFLRALYEDFDIDVAAAMISQIDTQANNDVLLKGLAAELKKNASILLNVVKCKLYGSVKTLEINNGATADDVVRVLDTEGYKGVVSGSVLTSTKAESRDPITVLHNQAFALFQRTAGQNDQFQQQAKKLNATVKFDEAGEPVAAAAEAKK